MIEFTPISALIGGVLLGFGALYWLLMAELPVYLVF